MPDNLPAISANMSNEDLMRATGQKVEDFSSSLPRLKVNYQDEDADGHELPRGYWYLSIEGKAILAKDVMFRPFYTTFQYSHYDQEEQKLVSVSAHFSDFRSEIIDSAGGFKCGKLSPKEREQLSPKEQEQQKSIKCSKVIYGLATISGKTPSGEDAEAANVPCVFFARGSNFMPMSGFFTSLTKRNMLMQTVNAKLVPIKKKNGGVTYWEIAPEVVDTVVLTPEDFELLTVFNDTIHAENEHIKEQWYKNRSQKKAGVPEAAAKILGGSIKHDFDDELPILA